MNIKRKLFALVLGIGVITGYGSAFAHAFHHFGTCDHHDAPAAPAP
jgi:hypothetical protein